MSTPILPFSRWLSGTNQNSIPANDNALRCEVLAGLVISDSVTAQPGSPADRDLYIIPAGATGAQWSTFDEDDLAIFYSGTWYAFAPVDGVVVHLDGDLQQWMAGTGWQSVSGGGGGGGGGVSPVETVSGSSLDVAPADAGKYFRFTGTGAKTATFDSSDGFSADQEFHFANRAASGNLTLVEAGSMTLNEPKGGTLVLEPGDTVTVKLVASNAADVMGSTEAA